MLSLVLFYYLSNNTKVLLLIISVIFIFSCGIEPDSKSETGQMDSDKGSSDINNLLTEDGIKAAALEADVIIGTEGAVLIGDADGSGVIDIVDALITAQYYVGLIPAFDC